MSVSRPYIIAALKRLSGKPFPPDTAEAMAEVIGTLARLAEDEEHVGRIIAKVLEVPGPYPEPAVFATYADMTATRTYMADPSCGKCGGCGFVNYTRGGVRVERDCLCCNPIMAGKPDPNSCLVCSGTGKYQAIRGGEQFSERCDCWSRRPKSLRPWAMEGSYGA